MATIILLVSIKLGRKKALILAKTLDQKEEFRCNSPIEYGRL